MTDLGDRYTYRDEVVRLLRLDVLGPVGGPDEVLVGTEPLTAYITGVLHPRRPVPPRSDGDPTDPDEGFDEKDVDLGSAVLGRDEQPDTGVAMANVADPVSMGLTFAVDPRVSPTVEVRARAAVYDPEDASGAAVEARRAEKRTVGTTGLRWRRRELDLGPVVVDVTRPFGPDGVRLAPGLLLKARVREPEGDAVAVTVTLVNDRDFDRFELLKDGECFFQTSLEVSVPEQAPALVERPAPADSGDDELLLNRLLYRHAPVFATGHGCAAVWDWTPPPVGTPAAMTDRAAVASVRTEFVPSHEVLLTQPKGVDEPRLSMRWLATAPRDEVLAALRDVAAGYAVWIDRRYEEAERLRGTEFGKVALSQVEDCVTALGRIRHGVDVLARSGERGAAAFEAFQLANQAMSTQRSRTSWIKDGRRAEPVEDGAWRPFQICFLLLCLAGIEDPDHPDRGVADLLWFPTGGGKTEAYLGLIAFTVFLRRLRLGPLGAGVTVLMRYTLRLLTLQQFERAAALMCAMETMRREDPTRLGTAPMAIGMWVGKAATPNTLKVAKVQIDRLRREEELQDENPVQLRSCPWCGEPLGPRDHEVLGGPVEEMVIRCPGNGCPFGAGLPVHVVDDEVYRVQPTLIIATVDKFARIAWRSDVASLFNRTGALPGTPPPELIVQDELHLISGPLGTLTGLYETAIDLAAGHPKVVASTATIRRAHEQGKALFDREVRQFPPAGLDARDSWFAVQAPRDAVAARRYVGLVAPSTSQASLLVRAYGSLLHQTYTVDGDDETRDPYWTLVGYFNSLRLLAAAELQVQDDVVAELTRLANRDGVPVPRNLESLAELTSRVQSSKIPRYLKDLERSLTADDGPLDVVRATNMISVGVDVDRLGLMVVMGQPQMTAEYIQATSRVGRRHPGLAVVLYNVARSRDRSHYENFTAFHSALYRQVESTSVTPFSARARDRALHAVYVGAARLTIPAARENGSAAAVEAFAKELERLRGEIVDRVSRISPDEATATDLQLGELTEFWRAMAHMNDGLLYEAPPRRPYNRQPRPVNTALLRSFSDTDLEHSWDTLWSLRDVDVEADLYLER